MSGHLSLSKNLDMKIRQIVLDCTQMQANNRPSIDDILDADYFREIQIQKKLGINVDMKNNKYSTEQRPQKVIE